MEQLEAFRKAVAALGNVSAEELAKYMEQHHGIKIQPSFIPSTKPPCKILTSFIRRGRRLKQPLCQARMADRAMEFIR